MASGRRLNQNEIQLTRRAWEDVAPELERWLQRIWDAQANGIPAGFNGLVPSNVQPGDIGAPGDEGDGWASASHEHPVVTGPPAGLANANTEGSSTAIPRADHQHKRDMRAKLEGADIATRNALNFEDSPSIDFQVVDDPGNDNVDVTAEIAAGVLLSQEAGEVPASSFALAGIPPRQRATVVFAGTYFDPVVTLATEENRRRFTVENLTPSGMTIRSSSAIPHTQAVMYDVHEKGTM